MGTQVGWGPFLKWSVRSPTMPYKCDANSFNMTCNRPKMYQCVIYVLGPVSEWTELPVICLAAMSHQNSLSAPRHCFYKYLSNLPKAFSWVEIWRLSFSHLSNHPVTPCVEACAFILSLRSFTQVCPFNLFFYLLPQRASVMCYQLIPSVNSPHLPRLLCHTCKYISATRANRCRCASHLIKPEGSAVVPS